MQCTFSLINVQLDQLNGSKLSSHRDTCNLHSILSFITVRRAAGDASIGIRRRASARKTSLNLRSRAQGLGFRKLPAQSKLQSDSSLTSNFSPPVLEQWSAADSLLFVPFFKGISTGPCVGYAASALLGEQQAIFPLLRDGSVKSRGPP